MIDMTIKKDENAHGARARARASWIYNAYENRLSFDLLLPIFKLYKYLFLNVDRALSL